MNESVDETTATTKSKDGPLLSNSTKTKVNDNGPSKMINVNVDYSSDQWVVVSYKNDKGDLFQGILLKANETNNQELPPQSDSISISSSLENSLPSSKQNDGDQQSHPTIDQSQSIFPYGHVVKSPTHLEWDPHRIPSLAFRRTLTNGFNRKDNFSLVNTKPALGIRRLENRSVRLRPTANQRTTNLCVRCQEHLIATPASRRSGNNGSHSSFSASILNNGSTTTFPHKRRSTDMLDLSTSSSTSSGQSNLKRPKPRNSVSVLAAETNHSAAITLPSVPAADGDPSKSVPATGNSSSAVQIDMVKPKVPKLKISFGNNAEKTTTIITLPPSHTSAGKKNVDIGGNGIVDRQMNEGTNGNGKNDLPIESNNGTGYEDVQLPYGLQLGDVVWAKMSSSPYWPARIFSVSGHTVCVTWCGSKQYGYVEPKALEPFKETFQKRYNAKRNGCNYQKAVAEAIIQCGDVTANGDSSSAGADFHYRHLISAACWKHLTGAATTSTRKGQNLVKNRGRPANRRGRSPKSGNYDMAADFVSSSTPISASSINSPLSSTATSPSIDWQPRVIIRTSDTEVAVSAQKSLLKLEIDAANETTFGGGKLSWSNFNDHTRPISPLPVEKSEEDDDDDDDDDFKLQIDESAHSDEREDDFDDEPTSKSSTDINISISRMDSGSFRLTPASSDAMIRHQLLVGDFTGQNQVSRVGPSGSQDDFESALTELQEMNEMCAGTSVIARC